MKMRTYFLHYQNLQNYLKNAHDSVAGADDYQLLKHLPHISLQTQFEKHF